MTYVKLDDGYGEHPKIVGLSDAAYRLFVNGLCYCSRRKTDGYIPGMIPRTLIACSARNFGDALAELENADLWERDLERNGWIVRDYLKHQRSRDQIEKEQGAARERWQRFRNGSTTGEQRADNGVGNGDATGELQPNRVVSEVRGQRSEVREQGLDGDGDGQRAGAPDAREHLRGKAVDLLKRAFNVRPSHAVTWLCVDAIEEFDEATVLQALRDTVARGGKSWAYTERVLQTYRREGITA